MKQPQKKLHVFQDSRGIPRVNNKIYYIDIYTRSRLLQARIIEKFYVS